MNCNSVDYNWNGISKLLNASWENYMPATLTQDKSLKNILFWQHHKFMYQNWTIGTRIKESIAFGENETGNGEQKSTLADVYKIFHMSANSHKNMALSVMFSMNMFWRSFPGVSNSEYVWFLLILCNWWPLKHKYIYELRYIPTCSYPSCLKN